MAEQDRYRERVIGDGLESRNYKGKMNKFTIDAWTDITLVKMNTTKKKKKKWPPPVMRSSEIMYHLTGCSMKNVVHICNIPIQDL